MVLVLSKISEFATTSSLCSYLEKISIEFELETSLRFLLVFSNKEKFLNNCVASLLNAKNLIKKMRDNNMMNTHHDMLCLYPQYLHCSREQCFKGHIS